MNSFTKKSFEEFEKQEESKRKLVGEWERATI